ncbi:ABC transporter substrate-binding protein [Caldimonas aquatica]|uniref:ABC transporter substrate-binding protein n=1 Tax=Caldimonas aquatica TaxID=376175 RepID=A0ABY6MU68_9BURK|nr:ABC transporter substrate-binding protein [Schlegelella aquatica]UZD55556.1 ABC transporter substrate-binding protein [Schlegelella aquatica]
MTPLASAPRRVAAGLALACALLLSVAPAAAQIRVGQPSGFTGPVAAGVKENTEGARLYLDAVNARGGVHGQKVELVSVDDKFDPKLTAELGRKLIVEQGVIALFLNRGTPHSQALMPLLKEYQIPLVAPSTGAMLLHQPVHPYIFNVRAPYQREAEKAVQHLASIGLTRIGILQVDDSFGTDAATGALRGFERTQLKPLFHEKFDRANPDIAKLAAATKQHEAQAVIFIGSAAAVSDGTRAIRAAGSRAQIVTLSNNASGGFIKQMGEHARGTIVTQVFPSERSLAAPIVKEAADLARAQGIAEVTPAMLEGYAAAKVLVEGLRRAGPNPTPAKLIQALESLRKVDIGGLEVSFSPTDHSGLGYADLSIIDENGKFRR